jgi:uncharacterized protein (TIGR03083 family)
VAHDAITRALAAEAAALQAALTGLTDQEFSLPSPCPPWTVGELLCHVVIGAGRVATALAEPEPPEAALVSRADAASYYRSDARFSTSVDADRIEAARALAGQFGGPNPAIRELERHCRESVRLLAAAQPDRAITTRHGDRMLLTDFASTRIVELAVHGLDLATGLGRPPWLTAEAASMLEELWLPAGRAGRLRQQLRCDRAGLIARLTGRMSLTPAEQKLLRDAGARSLALS